MTADAGRGDAEQCFAVGMDDFITKPVHLPELSAALERAGTTGTERGGDATQSPAKTTGTEEATLDFSVLASFRNLSEPGQPDPVIELIDLFLEDAPERLQAMHASVAQQDGEALQVAAHSLKGSARNLGARPLANICAELEHQAAASDWESTSPLLAAIGQEFDKLRALLAAEKQTGPP